MTIVEPWFAAHDRAKGLVREHSPYGQPINGIPEDAWLSLCEVIAAASWPAAGQVLQSRTVASIAGAVVQLLTGADKSSPAPVPEIGSPGAGVDVLAPGDLSNP